MIEAFVTAADDVTGPFDMILRTEARDPEEVGTKILPRLVRSRASSESWPVPSSTRVATGTREQRYVPDARTGRFSRPGAADHDRFAIVGRLASRNDRVHPARHAFVHAHHRLRLQGHASQALLLAGFQFSLVLLGMLGASIMMVASTGILPAVGILGGFSLIRFRTPVKDPKDMAYILFVLAVGLAMGARLYYTAAIITAIVSAAIIILTRINFGLTSHETIIRLTCASQDGEPVDTGAFESVLHHGAESSHLLSAISQGSRMELTYGVRRILEPRDPPGAPAPAVGGAPRAVRREAPGGVLGVNPGLVSPHFFVSATAVPGLAERRGYDEPIERGERLRGATAYLGVGRATRQ